MSDTASRPPSAQALPVIVGVDGSPESLAAVRWAADQAELVGAPLIAVTALPASELGLRAGDDAGQVAPTTRRLLGEAITDTLGAARAGNVALHLRAGPASRTLVQYSLSAQLVVVGPHSAGGLPGVMLGSVPQRVITYARCPVAVARPTPPVRAPRIVVGLDGSACARAALHWALRQAKLTGAALDALVAWDGRPSSAPDPAAPPDSETRQAAERLLESELGALRADQLTDIAGRVVQGKPATVLAAAARTAQLLVIGSRGAAGGFGHLLGSTGLKCLSEAPCTVVAIQCPPAAD